MRMGIALGGCAKPGHGQVMSRPKLNLLSREEFAAFSLHEKNAYLQELADRFAAQHDREQVILDKNALSRLRRYYSRRVWADLKLGDAPASPLNKALGRLAETIRSEAVREDVTAALLQETTSRTVLRTAPDDDAQLMFFVPAIYDAPFKDDVNLYTRVSLAGLLPQLLFTSFNNYLTSQKIVMPQVLVRSTHLSSRGK